MLKRVLAGEHQILGDIFNTPVLCQVIPHAKQCTRIKTAWAARPVSELRWQYVST
jgi:hypothetical protein